MEVTRDLGKASYGNSFPSGEFGTSIACYGSSLSLAVPNVGQVSPKMIVGRIWVSDTLLAGCEYCRMILTQGRGDGRLAAAARVRPRRAAKITLTIGQVADGIGL